MKRFIEKYKVNKIIISILIALLLFNFLMPNYSKALVINASDSSLLDVADSAGGKLLKPIVKLFAFIADSVLGVLTYFMWPDGSNYALYGATEADQQTVQDNLDYLYTQLENANLLGTLDYTSLSDEHKEKLRNASTTAERKQAIKDILNDKTCNLVDDNDTYSASDIVMAIFDDVGSTEEWKNLFPSIKEELDGLRNSEGTVVLTTSQANEYQKYLSNLSIYLDEENTIVNEGTLKMAIAEKKAREILNNYVDEVDNINYSDLGQYLSNSTIDNGVNSGYLSLNRLIEIAEENKVTIDNEVANTDPSKFAQYDASGEKYDSLFSDKAKEKYNDLYYSPEAIFSGQVDLLSINFISGQTSGGGTNSNSGWNSIRNEIATWYKALRLVAIVGLLSMLIYTGIKILLSANSAKDKAKYKEWIVNWFIAVIILFAMHYIMNFTVTVIDELSHLIGSSLGGIQVVNAEGIGSFTTNLIGLARFEVQRDKFTLKVGYLAVYIALITYTFKFTFIYLKRVLNMAFLTLIAPIVALTYPLDKMNDGTAQGFNLWLKEYVFNALLQPMHLIMYYVLAGSALDLMATNFIYGIVVLMFMSEGERLLKKIFGFDKAKGGTVGGMGTAFVAGTAAGNLLGTLKKTAGAFGGKAAGNAAKGLANAAESSSAPSFLKGEGINAFANLNPGSGATPAPETVGQNNSQNNDNSDAQVPQQYRNEGFGQNADGDYYNPYTDEYDPDYNPANDPSYGNNRNSNNQNSTQNSNQNSNQNDNQNNNHQSEEPQLDQAQDNEPEQQPQQVPGNNQREPNTTEGIRAMARRVGNSIQNSGIAQSKFGKFAKNTGRGLKAAGKRAIKPIWDVDRSGKYNRKRLVRNVGRVALGAGLGITAAAVQAGISITDGKYNPLEGIGTIAGGIVAGGAIMNKVSNSQTVSAYKEAYHSTDDDETKRKRYVEDWKDRDDINEYYSNYGAKKNMNTRQIRELKERAASNYVARGITNPKDIQAAMKYSSQLQSGGMTQEDADKMAAEAMGFKKDLINQQSYGAIHNLDKRKKYIDAMVEQGMDGLTAEQIRSRYENGFKAVAALDAAQR